MSKEREAQFRRLLVTAQDLVDRKAPVKWRMAQVMIQEIVRLRRMNEASERRILHLEAELEHLSMDRSSRAKAAAASEGDGLGGTPEDVDAI